MSLKEDIDIAVASGAKVLLDFYQEDCPPCKMVAMQLDKVEKENPDIKVFKLKAGGSVEESELFQEFGIRSAPQLYFYKDKVQIKHHIGAIPYSKIVDIFE